MNEWKMDILNRLADIASEIDEIKGHLSDAGEKDMADIVVRIHEIVMLEAGDHVAEIYAVTEMDVA